MAAHDGVFEFGRYPCWATPLPTADLRAYRDARLAAFEHRMTGTLLTGLYIAKIDEALRTERWQARSGIVYASVLLSMRELNARPEPVTRHMAAELNGLYVGSFSFRFLRERLTRDCILEAWFRIPLFG